MKHLTTTLALLVLLTACGQKERDATSAVPPSAARQTALTPEQLGALGAQIRKEPGRADQLLSQHGQTRESFEKAIREVTESPEASKRYAEAYRKASA